MVEFPSATLGPSKPCRRAVVDVGTNSVKLLVAEVRGDLADPILETSHQTRLGSGFYPSHILAASSISETAAVVKSFAVQARMLQCETVLVLGTSAAREAKNAKELSEAVYQSCGSRLQILTEEQESTWGFLGARSHPAFAQDPLMLLDLGGGSAQLTWGHELQPEWGRSFPLGTVRLLEWLHPSDPPSDADWHRCEQRVAEFFELRILPQLHPRMRADVPPSKRLVATGGTATILARLELGLTTFDRDRMESVVLGLDTMTAHRKRLWGMNLQQRRALPGLPANRADVILTGAALMEAFMRALKTDRWQVTTRGLRFAAVTHFTSLHTPIRCPES